MIGDIWCFSDIHNISQNFVNLDFFWWVFFWICHFLWVSVSFCEFLWVFLSLAQFLLFMCFFVLCCVFWCFVVLFHAFSCIFMLFCTFPWFSCSSVIFHAISWFTVLQGSTKSTGYGLDSEDLVYIVLCTIIPSFLFINKLYIIVVIYRCQDY